MDNGINQKSPGMGDWLSDMMASPSVARVVPFAAYLGFIAVAGLIEWTAPRFGIDPAYAVLWVYPIKITVVAAFLLICWSQYDELVPPLWAGVRELGLTLGVGVAVYVAWVRMDWAWATQGSPGGYNPFAAGEAFGPVMAGIRLFGAALVVPVMEELFWRSFLLRYLIAPNFTSVGVGTFTPVSFALTVIFFGVEHHLWLAGIMAGVAYTLLCYHTKRIWPCVMAHGVTNLCLGIHVLVTQEWQWW